MFVLGEEQHEVGSWFSLTRYSTVPSNPQKDVYIWPPNESTGIHRPVAMYVDDFSDGSGVSIRV